MCFSKTPSPLELAKAGSGSESVRFVGMNRKVELSNPDFEPSDEELQELSRRAFEGVGERYAQALKIFEQQIDVSRKEALAHVEAMLAKQP